MRGISSDFADIVRSDHESACAVDLIKGGRVIANAPVHGGTGVTADRTGAQLRTIEIEIADADLIPESQQSPVTPFGTRIQLWGGVVKPRTDLHEQVCDPVRGWSVSEAGVMDGLTVNGSGRLCIGP